MSGGRLRAPLVFLATYVLLTLVAFWLAETYLTAWLPLLRLESNWLLPHGLLGDAVTLSTRNGERLIALHVVTTSQLAFDGGTLPAGVGMRCTTLQAYALYHPVLVYAVLAAWPAAAFRERLGLLLLGAPCVLITTSLDIPFVLTGLAQDLVLEQFAPDRAGSDPRALYYMFLHGGGRLGLAVTGALLTALVARRIPIGLAARPAYKKA